MSADQHLATIAHDGKLWDAYLEFEDHHRHPETFRAKVRFTQAGNDGLPAVAQTTVIIIEESHEAALAKARTLDERQLRNMLRSALPEGDG